MPIQSFSLKQHKHCAVGAGHWPAVCPLVPSGTERWWGRWRRFGSPGLTWRNIKQRNNQLEASSSTSLHTDFKQHTNRQLRLLVFSINLPIIFMKNQWIVSSIKCQKIIHHYFPVCPSDVFVQPTKTKNLHILHISEAGNSKYDIFAKNSLSITRLATNFLSNS